MLIPLRTKLIGDTTRFHKKLIIPFKNPITIFAKFLSGVRIMLGSLMTASKKLIADPIKIFIKKFLIVSKKLVNGFAILETSELIPFPASPSNFSSLFLFFSTSAFFLSCSAFFLSIALCSFSTSRISVTTELIDFSASSKSFFRKSKISF